MKKKIVISDLDGTIALIDHRRPLVEGKQKDWQAFYAGCVNDEPNLPVIETLRALKATGHDIIIFSGRSDEVKQQTIEWLAKFDVPYDNLFMRREGDFTADEKLKRQWLYSLDRQQILCVFDDRQKVVNMWREMEIVCFQVAPGDF